MAAGKKKPKKIRVQFVKNRGKRPRDGDLTRRFADDEERTEDLTSAERLTGKGDLARHRTILAEESGADSVQRHVDLEGRLLGRVLAAIGSNHCRVETQDGTILDCSVRRVVRTLARDVRTAVVAGDRVVLTPTGGQTGVIERVESRTSALSRVSRGVVHVLAANVDQAVIVASSADPPLKPGLIDRFLCSAEQGAIRPIICINKIDQADASALKPIVDLYLGLGYEVVPTNALDGVGVDALRERLLGRETVFVGQSGVGKSSLLNALQPGLSRATGDVSEDSRKGRHTTRVTEMFTLEGGGWIVDTPGVRTLQLWGIPLETLDEMFVEFRPFLASCRFTDCTHAHEESCGVRDAVERGEVSRLRYESYLRIRNGDDD